MYLLLFLHLHKLWLWFKCRLCYYHPLFGPVRIFYWFIWLCINFLCFYCSKICVVNLMKCVLSLSTCLGGKLGFIMGPYAYMPVLGLLHAENVYCNVTHLHAGLTAHFLHFLLLFLVIMFTGTFHTVPKHHKTVALSSLLQPQIKPFLLPIQTLKRNPTWFF